MIVQIRSIILASHIIHISQLDFIPAQNVSGEITRDNVARAWERFGLAWYIDFSFDNNKLAGALFFDELLNRVYVSVSSGGQEQSYLIQSE